MKQRGMALLVVMLMVATMATVAVTTQENWQRAFARVDSQLFRQQAKWTLLGAEEWVRLHLLLPLSADNVHAGQSWAAKGQSFQLDDTNVSWRITDNQSCFNLNAITPTQANDLPRAPLSRRIFQHLLLLQGITATQAAALTVSLAAITPLQDVTQLRSLPGVDRTLWQRLAPLVCVQPHTRLRVNINTLTGEAGAQLLSALSQGVHSVLSAQNRLNARPQAGWPSATALIGAPPDDNALTAFAELQSVVTLSSDDMTLLLWTEQQPYTYQLSSRFLRSDEGFRVTERRYHVIE
ncbi:general secretion pathway protein GspK [Enterobacter cloacae]|uniref:general secretion pathway protein GspK n=1 Tax=Enterobacter cloacae TaxID=550 RepID=UPI00101B0090|nr:type II secretion system protein GspK [Enterobacter cloacae]QBC03377.1 general secretion pathway protein GspK [Enterobacter cloacae]